MFNAGAHCCVLCVSAHDSRYTRTSNYACVVFVRSTTEKRITREVARFVARAKGQLNLETPALLPTTHMAHDNARRFAMRFARLGAFRSHHSSF